MADWITELKERRILPAVGVYAGGCWVLIEILDRLVERYLLSPYLTDIVFWGLYSLIPAVVLVAWSHGRPGKDRATRVEKVGVPINIIATVGLLLTLFSDADLGPAAELVTVENEGGGMQEVYVPKNAYRRRLAVFFFDNKSGNPKLDWLQYGITDLLTQGLGHHPFLSANSPWSNWIDGFYIRMRRAGFEDGLDVPRSLMREIADDANRQYIIEGDVDLEDEELRITVRIWDTRNLDLIDEFTEGGWDHFSIVDELSRKVREALEVPEAERLVSDLPLAETYGESVAAFRHYLDGLNIRLFTNDVSAANASFDKALEADPNFVQAWFVKGLNLFEGGDMVAAQAALEQARALDYRLPDRDRATLKALGYRLAGETDKLIAFLRLQTQLHDDAGTHLNLARILMATGDLEGAKEAYRTSLAKDPMHAGILLTLANLERASGNVEGAIAHAEEYRQRRPEDEDAVLLLGDLMRDSGELDQARDFYLQAQFLADSAVMPLLRLAEIAARQGNVARARELIEQAKDTSAEPLEWVYVHEQAVRLESRLGRLKASIDELLAQREAALKSLPPISVAISIYSPLAAAHMELGDFQAAHSALDEGMAMLQAPLDQFLAYMRGYVLVKQNRLEEAVHARKRAEEIIDQFDFDALRFQLKFLDAEFSKARGDLEAAARMRAEALESAMHSMLVADLATYLPGFYADLARAQVDAGMLEEAERAVNAGLKTDPNEPKLWLEKARLQAASGNARLAAASVQYALAIWSDADEKYLHYVRARELAGRLASGG